MDILSYIIHIYFQEIILYEAQEKGYFPNDEPIDVKSIVYTGKNKNIFPFFLTKNIRKKIFEYHKLGKCKDMIPLFVVGKDNKDNYYSIAYMRITDDKAIFAMTGMKSQFFPVNLCKIIEEIAISILYIKLIHVISSEEKPINNKFIDNKLKEFKNKYKCVRASNSGWK